MRDAGGVATSIDVPDGQLPIAPEVGAPLTMLVLSPSAGRGGAETMLHRTVVAACARGWRVRCLIPAGPLDAALRDAGAVVRTVPALGLPGGPRAVAAARTAAAISAMAAAVRRDSRGADLVLANGLLCLPPLRAAHRSAARIWWAHDVLVRTDRLRWARATARGLDLVVGVSDAALTPLRSLATPMTVVRNGVDPVAADRGRPACAPTGGRGTVGIAAALTPWKGQDVLLEAVARLGPEGPVVELLGAAPVKDAAFEARLRARAAQPDLSGRVRFLGHVQEPLATMARWDVGVSASTDPEASGLGVLEAMSLGVPQVVTAHGGPPEVLGDAGLVVPPADVGALAEALARLLSEPELWRRCAVTGPRIVARDLNRPAQEAALLAVLTAAVQARRR